MSRPSRISSTTLGTIRRPLTSDSIGASTAATAMSVSWVSVLPTRKT